jgi:hypothetical protein
MTEKHLIEILDWMSEQGMIHFEKPSGSEQ